MVTIRFEGDEYRLEGEESMLDALVRGGANLPFSCRKGSCQICMMQRVSGDPGPEATKGLREGLVEHGMFLPCRSHPERDVEVARPDLGQLSVRALLSEKTWLSESIAALSFEPETAVEWRPGQFINLRRSDGTVRSYSIASIAEEDYFLTLHVKRIDGGTMSNWLLDELEVGEIVELQGPVGRCYYEPDDPERNLLMLATGTGLSPILAVCRDALRQGHRGRIVLYHGSRHADGLYLREQLEQLAAEHGNFSHQAFLTGEDGGPGVQRGRIVPRAFEDLGDLEGWMVYLAGVPAMVYEGRTHAVGAGVKRSDIRADPFEYAHGYTPDDAAQIAAMKPDPELWAALGHGDLLREILTDFYTAAYEDRRLSPFFAHVTKDRAIGQQYAFLSDMFSGERKFFGLRPFNAHHWMVISDELFDYREALIEGFMRKHGVEEPMIRRWAAIHEAFRPAIVKGSARGQVIDGKERDLAPPEDIVVECATLCDGCHEEMDAGVTGRFVPQTGQLFCSRCAGRTTSPARSSPRASSDAGLGASAP